MSPTIEQRIAFVKNTKLAAVGTPSHGGGGGGIGRLHFAAASDGDAQSAVAAGDSVLAFVAHLRDQLKVDVVNSTLFAQRAADAQYDHVQDVENWYKCYKDTLEMIGWSVQPFSFAKVDDVDKYGSVDRLVVHLEKQHLSADQFALLEKTIKALKQDENEAALKEFDNASKRLTTPHGNFQVGVAGKKALGNAVLEFGYFHFTTHPITKVLFRSFGQTVEFYHGHQSMTLNEDTYARLRDDVSGQLEKDTNDLDEVVNIVIHK